MYRKTCKQFLALLALGTAGFILSGGLVRRTSVVFNREINHGASSAGEAPEASFPLKDPEASVPLKAPEASLPLKTPEASFPLEAKKVSVPLRAPEASLPLKTPEASFPLKAPEASVPLKTPEASLPLKTPEASSPLEAPEASSPLKAPEASLPLKTPEASFPLKAPEASSPLEAPKASLPLKTPEASFPLKTPKASSPLEAPDASFPLKTPEASLPLEAPEASLPLEAPKASLPLKTPEASTLTKASSSSETSCRCRTHRFPASMTYKKQLGLNISWLNLTTREMLEKQHPNFPLALLENHGEKWCHLMPQPHAISWSNIYYQSVQVNHTTFFLYSAFFDNRRNTDLRPCVRVLAYTRSVEPATPWCYVWFNSSGPPIVTRVARMEYVDWLGRSYNRQMTYLMTCRIPHPEGGATSPVVPLAVSVVEGPCVKAHTLLQVIGAAERNASTALTKKENGAPLWNVAVCGPALFYYHEDFSLRIVEWLELLRAQGVAKVFLPITDVHPNIEKVLLYYEAEGFVKLVRFSYPEPYVNEPNIRRLWFLLEKIKTFALQKMYFTDCVLRHMHEYRFIAHFDPDEVPMLLRHDSLPLWLDAQLERVKANNKLQPATYKLAWYYHNSDLEPPPSTASLPKYLWAMRHTRRSNKHFRLTPGMFKPIFDMDLATGVFSHDVVTCASGRCQRKSSSCLRSEAYLGHYNYNCGDFCRTPNSTTEEPVLLRYKDQVLPAVAKVLKELQLL